MCRVIRHFQGLEILKPSATKKLEQKEEDSPESNSPKKEDTISEEVRKKVNLNIVHCNLSKALADHGHAPPGTSKQLYNCFNKVSEHTRIDRLGGVDTVLDQIQ